MFRTGALSFVLGLGVALACACSDGQSVTPPPPAGDAGPPTTFEACRTRYFGTYLNACSVTAECGGLLECDVTRKFAEAPHCHSRLCETDDECVAVYKDLCIGDDFHFECTRVSPLVPEECRVVQGPPP